MVLQKFRFNSGLMKEPVDVAWPYDANELIRKSYMEGGLGKLMFLKSLYIICTAFFLLVCTHLYVDLTIQSDVEISSKILCKKECLNE